MIALPPDTARTGLRLTPEGAVWLGIAALVGTVGWYKNLGPILVLSYLMFGLLLLNGWLARANARRVAARRKPSQPVYVGERTVVEVMARNVSRRTATAVLVDHTGEDEVRWLVADLAAGHVILCPRRHSFHQRGRAAHAPLFIVSDYPFGLARYAKATGGGGHTVVLPARGEANPEGLRRWLLRQMGGEDRARQVLKRITTDHADVRGVRPFRSGDLPRQIHWRSSARRGELMVREYDSAPLPELVVVVEPWLPRTPTDTDRANLEAALSLTVTVVHAWSRGAGSIVTVAVLGPTPVVRSGVPTEEWLRTALTPLADTEGSDDNPPLPLTAFGRSLARAIGVVVSSRPGSGIAAALTTASGRPFASLDPTLTLPWYRPPTGWY